MRTKNKEISEKIGLVDADLLCKGTRHPNLVLLKLAGYFRDHGIKYELITWENANLDEYKYIYLSRVFTFTKLPRFITDYQTIHPDSWEDKIKQGGTGFYATIEDKGEFKIKRDEDMSRLQSDPFLPGFSMEHQMPDYNIYNNYIEQEIEKKVDADAAKIIKETGIMPSDEETDKLRLKHRKKYKDYLDYSIGFLTRGCIRQCSFCVNKGVRAILPYSNLEDFVDNNRPYIYLWDDNFLSYRNWKDLLKQLNATGKPFQFRQGLDERVLDEERAKALSKSRYHGDFIFAFDQWKQHNLIERKLKIWKRYCKKTTKFYLFCGYELTKEDDEKLFEDVYYLFRRIQILMSSAALDM